MNTTNSSTVTHTANSYDYSNWSNQWKNMWVLTANEQNCDGQICPIGTFCMRPAVSMSPMHCVHKDFVYNVVGALKLGNKNFVDHHDQMLSLLSVIALYLIFLVLFAHLFVLGVRLRQLLSLSRLLPSNATDSNATTAKLSMDANNGSVGNANMQQQQQQQQQQQCGLSCAGGNAIAENGYAQTEFNSNMKYIAHQHKSGVGNSTSGGIGQMLLDQSQELHHLPMIRSIFHH